MHFHRTYSSGNGDVLNKVNDQKFSGSTHASVTVRSNYIHYLSKFFLLLKEDISICSSLGWYPDKFHNSYIVIYSHIWQLNRQNRVGTPANWWSLFYRGCRIFISKPQAERQHWRVRQFSTYLAPDQGKTCVLRILWRCKDQVHPD